MKAPAALILATLLLIAASARASEPVAPAVERLDNEAPERILFIGNSYLYYNDSLHNHVRRIAEEVDPDGDYRYKSATIGGASLSHHHIDTLLEPGRLGIDEPFELVVLQGGSGESLTDERRAGFRESALEMSGKARATGAEIALYMTHAYVDPHAQVQPGQIDTISSMYLSVANELDALVIPVGLAFERAYERRPDIDLHKSFDGSHPSLLGTYLAACVVYESIYGRPANEVRYDYFGEIDAGDAAFLRDIARETVQAFFNRDDS